MTTTATISSDIDRCLTELDEAKSRRGDVSLARRIALAEACFRGIFRVAERWIEAACRAKGIDPQSSAAAEEISAGPMATARYLRLVIQSLEDVQTQGAPVLPGRAVAGPGGRLSVPVFPTRAGLYDPILFSGFRANVWLEPGIDAAEFYARRERGLEQQLHRPGITLVLGAGNVSSIAATDALDKLLLEGRSVLLKMNPVNEYLGPIFEELFAELIENDFLRIVYGGAEQGAYAVEHPRVSDVHITGSAGSHDNIVWGSPGEERERRKAVGEPLLGKTITSELGNVTPWIVIPATYSERELDFQAENVASTIVNNASFNCIATKMIVTHAQWPQRDAFLGKIEQVLRQVPRRVAYYPGAGDRFRRFAGREPDGDGRALPWTLLRDVDPNGTPRLFDEESFVCVCGETAIEAADTEAFLQQTVRLVNERMWGTLGAGVMVHPTFRQDKSPDAPFPRFLTQLHYGTIGVNHWPGLAFGMMSCPWGGFPGATLDDPQSGIGWVHNVYLLDGVEKTILEGPLAARPKPLWFPTHAGAAVLARKVLAFYKQPRWWKLPNLLATALRG